MKCNRDVAYPLENVQWKLFSDPQTFFIQPFYMIRHHFFYIVFLIMFKFFLIF